jgi:serine/threonine-protein kinase
MAMAFSPEGSAFASATSNGSVLLWRVARGGSHAPLPVVVPLPATRPPPATQDERDYAAAMDLVMTYDGVRKQLDDAEALLRAILARNPRSALAFAGLARLDFQRGARHGGDHDPALVAKSLDEANRAIALDPKLAEGYVSRGWAADESKDAAGAREAVATALRLDPLSPRALLLAARLSQDDGNLEGAEKTIRDLLSRPIDPRFAANAFGELESVYFDEGDFDAAEAAYQKVIELNPGSAWAKGNYAEFLVRKGDADGAIAMAKQALSLTQYGSVRRTLAEAHCAKGEALLWDSGDADGAQAAFASAAAADAKYGRIAYDVGASHQYLGVTRKDTGQLAQARNSYRDALTLDPQDARAKAALAALGE